MFESGVEVSLFVQLLPDTAAFYLFAVLKLIRVEPALAIDYGLLRPIKGFYCYVVALFCV